jgi:hypothetical protein
MKIKCHEYINPNYPYDAHARIRTSEQFNALRCFLTDEKVWRNNIARERGTEPDMLRWMPVAGTGTDVDICEITGMNCMCDEWELVSYE